MYIKKFLKNNIKFYLPIFVVAIFFLGYSSVDAATLKVNLGGGGLLVGKTTVLNVVLDSSGVAINNAEAVIKFPKDLIEVVSVNKSGSIFSLWVEDPVFSNTLGTITFNGGLPTPGFAGNKGAVISITVKAKKTGQAEFSFSGAAVRANDGLGTDVLSGTVGTIIPVSEVIQPVVDTKKENLEPAVELKISSSTHPIQDGWYKEISPILNWTIPSGVDAVQTNINTITSTTPFVTHIPSIKEQKFIGLNDGVWYFKARARKSGKWGSTSTYIVQIDNTIPDKKNVVFAYDDNKKILNINADITDVTSGLDYYEIFIDNFSLKKILVVEFVGGNYNLAFDVAGDHNIKLVAVDRAGNAVESVGSFRVTATEVTAPVVSPDKELIITMGYLSGPAFYFVLLAVLVIILLISIAFYLGTYYHKFYFRTKVDNAMFIGDNMQSLSLSKKLLEKYLEILQRTRRTRILSNEEKEIKEAIESDLDEVDQAIAKIPSTEIKSETPLN